MFSHLSKFLVSVSSLKGIRRKPQQDSARAGHPAEEPGQTRGVPGPLPDGQIRGRAVLRREELSDKADPGPEEARGSGGGLKAAARSAPSGGRCKGGGWSCRERESLKRQTLH